MKSTIIAKGKNFSEEEIRDIIGRLKDKETHTGDITSLSIQIDGLTYYTIEMLSRENYKVRYEVTLHYTLNSFGESRVDIHNYHELFNFLKLFKEIETYNY